MVVFTDWLKTAYSKRNISMLFQLVEITCNFQFLRLHGFHLSGFCSEVVYIPLLNALNEGKRSF